MVVIFLVQGAKKVNEQEGHPERVGCHWKFSGAQKLWRKAFPELSAEDENTLLRRLVVDGKLVRRNAMGGDVYYLPEDWSRQRETKLTAERQATIDSELGRASRWR